MNKLAYIYYDGDNTILTDEERSTLKIKYIYSNVRGVLYFKLLKLWVKLPVRNKPNELKTFKWYQIKDIEKIDLDDIICEAGEIEKINNNDITRKASTSKHIN